jgi:hypothetical protein
VFEHVNTEKNTGETIKIKNTLNNEIKRLTELNLKLNKEINTIVDDTEKLKKV